MRHTLLAAASALVLGLASAGCASMPAVEGADTPTVVRVQNYNSLTVVVEAVSSGDDYRLGQVETTNTETFTLPRTVNELDVRILVDPIGSPDTFLSDELIFTPGDIIQVDVESNLDLTTVTIR